MLVLLAKNVIMAINGFKIIILVLKFMENFKNLLGIGPPSD